MTDTLAPHDTVAIEARKWALEFTVAKVAAKDVLQLIEFAERLATYLLTGESLHAALVKRRVKQNGALGSAGSSAGLTGGDAATAGTVDRGEDLAGQLQERGAGDCQVLGGDNAVDKEVGQALAGLSGNFGHEELSGVVVADATVGEGAESAKGLAPNARSAKVARAGKRTA